MATYIALVNYTDQGVRQIRQTTERAKALINAAVTGHNSTFGYTFVMVNREASPQSLTLWHSGKTVLTAPVNTGIAQAPTVAGTFPVFEHLRETTMDPKTRGMIRITLPQEYEERASTRDLVERLMGKNPEHRFAFIQANASALDEEAIDA